jgi:hypothetical protein
MYKTCLSARIVTAFCIIQSAHYDPFILLFVITDTYFLIHYNFYRCSV